MKQMLFIMNPCSGIRRANRLLVEILDIFNRADYAVTVHITAQSGDGEQAVLQQGKGMDSLLKAIEKALGQARHHVVLRLPYSMGGMVETLHNNAQVKNTEYTADGIEIETILDDILYGRLREYVIKEV